MIFEEDGIHHLEIDEVVPEDVGQYTAIAENEYGKVSCSTELFIKGSAPFYSEISILFFSSNLVILYNEYSRHYFCVVVLVINS